MQLSYNTVNTTKPVIIGRFYFMQNVLETGKQPEFPFHRYKRKEFDTLMNTPYSPLQPSVDFEIQPESGNRNLNLASTPGISMGANVIPFDASGREVLILENGIERGEKKRTKRIPPLVGVGIAGLLLAACTPPSPTPNPDAFVPFYALPTPKSNINTTDSVGAPRTGIYSKEALLSLLEIQPRPKIDGRIGIVHIDGRYPSIGFGNYKYGVDVAEKLGVQTLEVELSPSEPNKYNLPMNEQAKLVNLVTHPVYSYIFHRPELKNIILTVESSNHNNVLTAWDLYHPGQKFTKESLQSNYDEFYDFARKLLDLYGDNGQNIIIQFPNELDWHLLGELPMAENRVDEDAPQYAINNAIALLNTRMQAIRDANRDFPTRKPLLTSIEINRVLDALLYGRKRAVNEVLSQLTLPPDIIGYSTHDSLQDPEKFRAAIKFIKKLNPKSAVTISEWGLASSYLGLSDEQITKLLSQDIQIALQEENLPFFIIWSLFDNDCSHNAPNSNQCAGYGLIEPDGSVRSIYRVLRNHTK